MKLDTPGTIAESIDRFRAAFAKAGIHERDVKVTWDGAEGWCRLRCRLPGGASAAVIERVKREDPAATPEKGRAERLMHEMSVWTLRAAKRLKAGGEFIDDTATVIAPKNQEVPRG